MVYHADSKYVTGGYVGQKPRPLCAPTPPPLCPPKKKRSFNVNGTQRHEGTKIYQAERLLRHKANSGVNFVSFDVMQMAENCL